jgi:DhnA family fructose-bisphosphate aldolase class Ia
MTGPAENHRLNHIFRDDGRVLIVAMDHASLYGAMPGLENPGEVIRRIRQGGADAILTTYGVSKQFAEEIGGMGLILRADGGISLLAKEPEPLSLLYGAEDALRLGADAIGCMGMPGSKFEGKTLAYLADLVAECSEWNLPVMAEMLPGGFQDPDKLWTAENLAHACRIGAEMGVDFIKTAYSGDVDSFRRVVEQVYVPLVVLGGRRSDDPRELLTSVHGAIQAGTAGVAIGRNIYQYPAPEKITAAVAAIIHDNASVDAALEYLR